MSRSQISYQVSFEVMTREVVSVLCPYRQLLGAGGDVFCTCARANFPTSHVLK